MKKCVITTILSVYTRTFLRAPIIICALKILKICNSSTSIDKPVVYVNS